MIDWGRSGLLVEKMQIFVRWRHARTASRWPAEARPHASSRRQQVRELETVALDDLADADLDGPLEHRAVRHERMKLAALAARVDGGWQRVEERAVEHTAREAAVEMPWIDARESRSQSARHHLAREHAGVPAPQRIHAGHPVRGELLLAV